MRRILIAAVASSLLTGAVIAAAGIAQSGDDKSTPPPTMAQALKKHEAKRDQHAAAVAKRLGVSSDDLRKAVEKVRAAELDQAVQDGRLTDAQRDAIEACKDEPLTCDRSNLPAPRMERLRRGDRPNFNAMRKEMRTKRNEFFAAVAKELGKDTADVRTAFEAERPERGPGGPGRHHGPGGPGMIGPGPGPGGPGPGPGGPGGPGF